MNRNRILLISLNVCQKPYPIYPIGLSYISSYIKENNKELEVEIFDLNINSNEDLVNKISNFDPAYIGLSIRNTDNLNIFSSEFYVDDYKKIVEIIRNHSSCKIIIGGAGYSIFPELLFKHLDVDFGIVGEGEEPLSQLIYSLNNELNFKTIPGLIYKDNDIVIVNKRSNERCKSYIKTLFYDESILDFYWKNSGMLNIQTKRGCPNSCIYCTYPIIEGSVVRTLNVDSIIKTINDLSYRHKVNYFFFIDSVFNIDDEYNYQLAKAIIKNNLKIKWCAYFQPKKLDKELMKLLKLSGLTHIEFGTESLSNTQLKNYSKSFTFDDVVRSSEICNELDIYFAHFMILGGYGETNKTIDETFENSKKLKNTVFFPFIGMRIYPGTHIQKIAIKENVIDINEKLIEPKYYIAKDIDYHLFKQKAKATSQNWIFTDDDSSEFINRLRNRNRKGPLWHHLKM